jgi:uncharacterized protein (TIRG00374 family)
MGHDKASGELPAGREGSSSDGPLDRSGASRREPPARQADPPVGTGARGLLSRLPKRQVIVLAIAAVALYFVWPQLVSLFSQVPRLRSISWLWFVLMAVLEAGSFACDWGLMRLALNERSWFLVGTTQLTSNALSKVLPGGGAAGATTSFEMLDAGGVPSERIVSGLTATTLISVATLLSLPVLSLPAVLFGGVSVSTTLMRALTYGAIVFALVLAVGALALFTDRPLEAVGTFAQRVRNRLARHHQPLTNLPRLLIDERNVIRTILGRKWWAALLYAAGNLLLDYGALLAALAAVGARPRASLVLLAEVVAQLLGMVPHTPGGLGFVEVGLAATLSLAGVGVARATLATLAYRLVAFWLPIPEGGVAYALYRRRYSQQAGRHG